MSKKFLCLLLALIMVVSVFAACGKTDKPDDGKENNGEIGTPVDPYAGKEHGEISEDLYNKVLGEFDTYYKAA